MRQLTYWQKYLLIALGVLALSVVLAAVFKPEEEYRFPEPLSTVDEGTTDLSDKEIVADETFLSDEDEPTGKTNFSDKVLTVDKNFTSNLPLVVLDTNGAEPKRSSYFDQDKGYYVPLDIDPYAYGSISVIDRGKGPNSLNDNPTVVSSVKMKVRGNSSGNYDKQQYLLRLTDEKGHLVKENLLGLGSDSEWILNVSFIDKSLMRNYLAYLTSGEIMPYVPDVRFCEVIWKNGDVYNYEGVYMLMESVSVGKNRVDLPDFSENSAYLPFLIRRDRYNLTGTILENYSTQQNILSGFLDVKWPEPEILSEQDIQKITDQINEFELAIFSEDYETFIHYRDLADMDSFVDYFIINEFFLNYDAGFNSTYLYSDYSGKLTMGPVWDFDQAMDNNESVDAHLYTTAFHSAPWFQQILRDPEFTRLIVERYQELRQSILSDESIQAFINGTVEGLGSAIDRDWARWGYYYRDGNYLKEEYPGQPNRNTQTHQAEIEKLENVLFTHGAWMDKHLDSLYQFADHKAAEYKPEPPKERDWGGVLALLYVSIFFISITLVQRSEQTD